MDLVIEWCQRMCQKQYLVKGEAMKTARLSGKHVKETTAPQAFGFTSIEKLIFENNYAESS